MRDKHIQYVVWEYDGSGYHDEIYRSPRLKIVGDIITHVSGFKITEERFQKGVDLLYGDPDEKLQNYFIEVIPLDISASSKKFGVDSTKGLMEVESARSPSMVKDVKAEKKKDNGKCPNCEKEITVQELQQVYAKVKDVNILIELCKYLNKYRKRYKLDTCARKAHFFAQSIQETGLNLEPGIRGEGFNYYKDNLAGNLGAFRSAEGKIIAQRYGRQELKGELAESNQIILANYAYGPQYKTGKMFNNTGNDGWNFRGRGLLQITGRSNYEAIQNTINSLSPESKVNILKKYDSPDKAISVANGYMTVEEAVLTGLADWYKEKMYVQADKTGIMKDDDVVSLIVDIINKYTDSRDKRKAHYQKTKTIFIVNNCKNINKTETKEEKKSKKKGYDIDAAVSFIISNAKTRRPYGDCALYVRKAINAGGISGSWGDAWQYITALPKIGFTDLGKITSFKKGDIVVFNKTGGRKWGHIAMWTGTQWVSDFKQNSIIVHNDYIGKDYHIFRWQ